MAIYSTSRISSMRNSALADVVANESYVGTTGLSRALYESMVNDQSIFEAVIGNDFKQLNGLHEGTLLESELQALDEASMSGFFETVKANLKKLWEKIKGVFKTVYAKMTQWIVRHGKSYVALHRKEIETKDFRDFTLKKYRAKKTNSGDPGKIVRGYSERVAGDIKAGKGRRNLEELQNDNYLNALLGATLIGVQDVDSKNYKAKAIEYFYEAEKEYKGSTVLTKMFRTMMDNVSLGSKPIDDLRKAEKKAGEEIQKAIKEIDVISKSIKGLKDGETHKDADGKETGYTQEIMSIARAYANMAQRLVSITTSGAIAVVRFGIKEDRAALARAVAYNPNAPKSAEAQNASALFIEAAEAEAEFDTEELYDDSAAEVPEEFAPELADAEIDDSNED